MTKIGGKWPNFRKSDQVQKVTKELILVHFNKELQEDFFKNTNSEKLAHKNVKHLKQEIISNCVSMFKYLKNMKNMWHL